MKKFAFIGAGSITFTRELVRDLLSFRDFSDSVIALMDVSEERLAIIKSAVDRIIEAGKYPAKVITTTNRVDALKDADGVVCTIKVGGIDICRYDVEIPKKYGVDINVGDTRGPAGIFRALRTIPVMFDICRDIDKYCPEAVVINYTNPMTMICHAVQAETKIKFIGLCHSVQDCAAQFARWIEKPIEEITYTCAGINHQAWYLDVKWNRKDAYPLLREAMNKPVVFNEELVRNEMFLQLGYIVTESSGHNSEYNAWFRKRPDLIEKYCTHSTGNNPGFYGTMLRQLDNPDQWKEEIKKWNNEVAVDLKKGHEYATSIFNAIIGDGTPFKFNGNVRNYGLIDNLPEGSCVEVPILASKLGWEAIHVGALPQQLAVLNSINAQCEVMAAEAAVTGDPMKVFHAICYDPLTSAVLSLAEIKSMVNELFEVNRDWLPQFKCFKV